MIFEEDVLQYNFKNNETVLELSHNDFATSNTIDVHTGSSLIKNAGNVIFHLKYTRHNV